MPDQRRVPRQTRRFLEKDLHEEFLIYDDEGDRVQVLNGTAREIYVRCDGSRSIEDLAREIRAIFEVDEATALRDVEATVRELTRLGILSLD